MKIMFGFSGKSKVRRRQVREKRAKASGSASRRLLARAVSWPVLVTIVFAGLALTIALFGETRIKYAPNQYIQQPIEARVEFQVPDENKTNAAREAARRQTPSYYKLNAPTLTYDRVRADLMRLFQAAADAESFEAYEEALKPLGWPADRDAFKRLRGLADMPNNEGRARYKEWIDQLPLESQYVWRGLLQEPREHAGTANYILLEVEAPDAPAGTKQVGHDDLVAQGNQKALRGAAADVARIIPYYELRSTIEGVVVAVFKQQPTLIYDRERTAEAMREAEEAVPIGMTTYPARAPIVEPGVIGSAAYALLEAEHKAYLAYLQADTIEAEALRHQRQLQRAGIATEVVILSVTLIVFVGINQRRILDVRTRTLAFTILMLGMLAAARAVYLKWPMLTELVYAPALLAGIVLVIAYPRRFALGTMAIASVLVTTTVQGDFPFVFVLVVGMMVAIYQLDEIRSRTKLPVSGTVAALAMIVASIATGLVEENEWSYVMSHALWAGGGALMASFVASALLPFIERVFRIATSLTLLEWRDPTRPLLQLLAREAPGTYSHSLVLGTLAEAACERIGANGLLAQVGALYHDIGKIHKSEYFAENQAGSLSRHDNLAPTMSLLIIVGHVKDGIEMAREYKLPRVLHQFIEEHHGTTVVRYFHHVASEKQPQIASGKHDREVSEAEFRYGGPKPRQRESAVLMMCDGVEGAVRALSEPTAGRIETVVHRIITDRLNDGQFDDCDITLREIHQVEDSLVKTLSSIYHGRVPYPTANKSTEESESRKRVLV